MKKKTYLPYQSPQTFECVELEQTLMAASVESESIEGLVKDEEYNW